MNFPAAKFLTIPLILLGYMFLMPVMVFAQASQSPLLGDADRRLEGEILSDLYGSGDESTIGRIFFSPSEDSLCAVLGLRSAPKGLQPGYFVVTRMQKVDGKTVNKKMKFKFPRKPDHEEGGLKIRRACIDAPKSDDSQEMDDLVVAVREPDRGALRSTVRFSVRYPTDGSVWGLDIIRLSSGDLEARDFTRE